MEEIEYALRVGMNNKHVPLVSAEDRDHADFEFTGAYDTQILGKAAKVGKTVCYVTAVFALAAPGSGGLNCEIRPLHEVALIMTDLTSGQVIFARQTYTTFSMPYVAEEFADFLNHAILAKVEKYGHPSRKWPCSFFNPVRRRIPCYFHGSG